MMQPVRPAILLLALAGCAGCENQAAIDCATRPRTPEAAAPSPNPAAYRAGEVLLTDSFANLDAWKIEREAGGAVRTHDGVLEIDVPRGCTVWLTRELSGPVMIEYEARMIQATPPGPNDRVSDLNCFWMATDPRNAADFFSVPARNGAFASYNQLLTYYVGQGGNTNTTTRFRRYIGDAAIRPILPEHDLSAKEFMLAPNVWQKITLIACGNLIEYYRDNRRIFSYTDSAPYTRGYFGIRTTQNHMEVRGISVRRLLQP